jgi:hypothetical protein
VLEEVQQVLFKEHYSHCKYGIEDKLRKTSKFEHLNRAAVQARPVAKFIEPE